MGEIDKSAWDAWVRYEKTAPPTVKQVLESLNDDQYFACDEIFSAGFREGVAFLVTHGIPKEKDDGNTLQG